jgi:YVTN family beta-propeller protein
MLLLALPAVAQVVTATIPTGIDPWDVAVNPNTNKVYVANKCNPSVCQGAGTITVIDGSNSQATSVNVGYEPVAVGVNSQTNKIYVANHCGGDPNCASAGTVSVIDGATNNVVATVNVGYYPNTLAVNETTNQIYVMNYCLNLSCQTGSVTVIDASNGYNTTTVTIGYQPQAIALDSSSLNKAYAVNLCASASSCPNGGTVTAIDGNHQYQTASIAVGFHPQNIDVNPTTHQAYVSNHCGSDPNCSSLGTVTVIDGLSYGATPVTVGAFPNGVAVNATTNQIYVANQCGSDLTCHSRGTVTVIDGATNNTSSVGAAYKPHAVAVDAQRNKVYVTDFCGNDPSCQTAALVTAIDAANNNATAPVAIGDGPTSLAVNATSNVIYVANGPDNSVSAIGGATKLQLTSVTPCRLVDTRSSNPIPGGSFETFNLPNIAQSQCPSLSGLSSAAAYSLNVTLVPVNNGPVRYLTIWPASQIQPGVSLMNSPDARVKANAAIVPAGVSGGVSVYVTNTTNVILDLDGYFAPSSQSTLVFYPLTPCRVADTRSNSFPSGLGSPYLYANQARDFPILSSDCNIPDNAQAYSLNLTAVAYPGQGSRLGYLEVWPTGQEPANPVSTLNNPTGTNVANAAIVPAGTGSEITVYPSNDTNLLIDINGYFAPAGQGGYSLYPSAPCRVIDTRQTGNGQPFTGTLNPPVDVAGSPCAPPTNAMAYVFNATAIPSGSLRYLTLWPYGESQPGVSTLNASEGLITSNMAIVPNYHSTGKTNAYAAGYTQLILDISSYFAP